MKNSATFGIVMCDVNTGDNMLCDENTCEKKRILTKQLWNEKMTTFGVVLSDLFHQMYSRGRSNQVEIPKLLP
jgi:hypothetical protein